MQRVTEVNVSLEPSKTSGLLSVSPVGYRRQSSSELVEVGK